MNCPNCGAPITGNQCNYCGTWFIISNESKINNITDLDKQRIALKQSMTLQSILHSSTNMPYNLKTMFEKGRLK